FFQFEGAQLTLAKFFIVVKSVDDTDDHAINEEVEMPHFHQERLESSRKKQRITADRELPLSNQGSQSGVGHRSDDARQEVNSEAAMPIVALEVKLPGEPDDWKR